MSDTSKLHPRELEIAIILHETLERVSQLSAKERRAVYYRMEQLNLFTHKLTDVFEQNILRMNRNP